MSVPTAPNSTVKEVHVSVKRSRDYQAIELSAVAPLDIASGDKEMIDRHAELFLMLNSEAEKMLDTLAPVGAASKPASKPASEPTSPADGSDQEFLFGTKPDKAKGPKQFRYLPESVMSKRELEDTSKDLAAAKGFDRDELIAFDNRDRMDRPGWGACVVKAKRGSALAGKLGDRDTVGYTAWDAEGKLVIDIWAKI